MIIDASDKDYVKQTEVSRGLLAELNAAGKPVLYVFNKCDKPAADIPRLTDAAAGDTLYISAKTGQGVGSLIERLEQLVTEGKQKITLRIPNSDQGILNSVYKNATVTEVQLRRQYVTVRAVAEARHGDFGSILQNKMAKKKKAATRQPKLTRHWNAKRKQELTERKSRVYRPRAPVKPMRSAGVIAKVRAAHADAKLTYTRIFSASRRHTLQHDVNRRARAGVPVLDVIAKAVLAMRSLS